MLPSCVTKSSSFEETAYKENRAYCIRNKPGYCIYASFASTALILAVVRA